METANHTIDTAGHRGRLGLTQSDMERENTVRKIDVYVFYFDVVGFVEDFLSHGDDALCRLRQFQHRARRQFEFGREHSYVVTLYDNVWARVNATEPGLPSLLLDFAGHVMRAAQSEGFGRFFGSITRGVHDFVPGDRMLVGGESFEDLREQHLDMTSEPHIRAALSEKWCRDSQFPNDCVWSHPMPSSRGLFPHNVASPIAHFSQSEKSLILRSLR